MSEKNNFDWKVYESVTKYIYETLGKEFGVKIVGHGNNFSVTGKSGTKHQIDVLTSHSDGIHSYQTAIECKYRKKKVNKDVVMKLSEIIKDAGIEKGIIVSKSGFTKDALNFAKQCSIGLVQLREIVDEEMKSKVFEIGTIEICHSISILRPEILRIEMDSEETKEENEITEIYHTSISTKKGNQIPLTDYIRTFKNELHQQNKIFQRITKYYPIIGSLINKRNNYSLNINGLIFTGVLNKIDSNSSSKFSLVEEVWLILKSIFDERTFSISENGIIIENKK